MDKVKDKIERWKLLADVFLKQNKKAFIREINGDLHFCNLVLNGDDAILIVNFGPEQRAMVREKIYWVQVEDFDEYKDNNKKRVVGNGE